MSKKNGNSVARGVQILIVIILVISAATSLIAWGSKGFTDWNVLGWFGYTPAPEETPTEPAAVELAYKFMPASAAAQAAAPRALSTEAEAEYAELLSANGGKDLTTTDYLSKIIVKSNVDNKTVTAANAGIKVAVINIGMKTTAIFVPRANPFDHLQAGYTYKNSHYYLNSNPSDIKNCIHDTFCTYYNMFTVGVMEMAAADFPSLSVIYVLEQDPNFIVPLPDEPTKEGYTFAGWYYGAAAEHGTNCTPYGGEQITINTKLHAHFNINRYNVTFDAAGGKDIQAQVVDWNTVLTPPTPERTGYDFKGWFLENGTEYAGQAIKQDTTLTAKWEIKTFTVTFYVGGEIYTTKTVNYGTTFSELAEEAKNLNLKVLTVLTEQGEQTLDEFAQVPITGDYSVTSIGLTKTETVQHFIAKYPYIFFAFGGALSVIVGIIGAVAYRKQTAPATPARRRNNRSRSRRRRY